MQSSTWIQWFIDQPWAIEIFIAIAFIFLLNVVIKRILSQLQRKAKPKESDWRHHLEYAALTPIRALLWVILISIIFDLGMRKLNLTGIFFYVTPIRNAAIIFCVAWFLLRFKKVMHSVISNHHNRKSTGGPTVDPFTLDVISKIFTICVLFISLLIIMQLFGLNIVPLITFGGIGAATLGFAGKDAISNFFGGLMIYLTRPFMINDLIEIPERNILGNVEEIGWYLTSIRDLQKRPIYVPNSVFSTEALINQSRMTHRRIEESIGIRQSDISKLPKIIENIHSLFEHHTSIDHHQSVRIFLEKFADSSLQIEIKVYCLCTRYEDFMEMRQEILMQIYRIIYEAGAEMPNPTMSVVIQK